MWSKPYTVLCGEEVSTDRIWLTQAFPVQMKASLVESDPRKMIIRLILSRDNRSFRLSSRLSNLPHISFIHLPLVSPQSNPPAPPHFRFSHSSSPFFTLHASASRPSGAWGSGSEEASVRSLAGWSLEGKEATNYDELLRPQRVSAVPSERSLSCLRVYIAFTL